MSRTIPTAATVVLAFACAADSTLAQVTITDGGYRQFVYVETSQDGFNTDHSGGTSLDDYSSLASASLGDPTAASGSASLIATTLSDASTLVGVLEADSYALVTSENPGYCYTESKSTIRFTLSSPMTLVTDFSVMITGDPYAAGYFLYRVVDIDSSSELVYDEYDGATDEPDVRRVTHLGAGNYYVEFFAVAESSRHFPDGEYVAHTVVSYNIHFVPAPGSLLLFGMTYGYARRRRSVRLA